MTEFDMKEVKKEAEEIFREIRGGNWEKFVRLQFYGYIKKQVGKSPYNKKNTALKSAIINLLIERGFIKERGEIKKTIHIVTMDSYNIFADGGYLGKQVHEEYGFFSRADARAYYSAQKKIREELGLDCSTLEIYQETRII
ncbi:MAG: hypothetical protein KJ600_06595 [Nanoarchaeota archaeon]|nr:hypothetical protein [Nanoarchaeota archaeon]